MSNPDLSKSIADKVARAACAHTDLNVFASVVSLLEGGHLYNTHSDKTAFKIIDLCKREQQRLLREYDRAVAAIAE